MLDSKLSELEEKSIMIVFSLVIILGFFGNILVIWTVVFNKHMRTTSNLFILNLAISDMTLCVFSIPFNAYKTLKHSWIFGLFLCKFAPFFQATNVFVSTMSITAIALDRYVSIVCAMRVRQSKGATTSWAPILIIIFIWLFAFLLSSPLFFFNTINSMLLDFNDNLMTGGSGSEFNQTGEDMLPGAQSTFEFDTSDLQLIKIDHCIESSPFMSSRLIYSYVSLLIQYMLPIIIVGLAYGSIWYKLKTHRNKLNNHRGRQHTMTSSPQQAHQKTDNRGC
jgi:neuropeptide F receptor